jgi:hypothetical protein
VGSLIAQGAQSSVYKLSDGKKKMIVKFSTDVKNSIKETEIITQAKKVQKQMKIKSNNGFIPSVFGKG